MTSHAQPDPRAITDEELVAYAADHLEPARAAAVAAHLAAAAEAAAAVARYRLAREVVRADALAEPPAAAVARAKAIFPRKPALSELLGGLRRVVAELTFDSRSGMAAALAGFRGGLSAYQVAFAGAGAEVDVQLEPPVDGGVEARWQVLGQVTTDDEPPSATVYLTSPEAGDHAVAEAVADEHGVFGLAALPGRYDLLVRIDGTLIVLPDLEIG